MEKTQFAHVEAALHWQSMAANHTERRYFERINFWRDLFPRDMGERLAASAPGATVTAQLERGELVPAFDGALVRRIRTAQFQHEPRPGLYVTPHVGRYYPLNFLHGVPGFFSQDRRPFRVLGVDAEHIQIDVNHPLAAYPVTVEARVLESLDGKEERGGRCNDIGPDLAGQGTGFQAPLPDCPTDFFSADAFTRMDPRDDLQFYGEARLVQHIDACARAQISDIYARFLRPGMRVLDLMSSWVSHLPQAPTEFNVVGLGLNAEELARNPSLSSYVVHDLNANPVPPLEDASFDAVLCTVSVEYLTRPIEVFAAVARVLKPGAPFLVSFSERWFPTKVIRLWTDLHPFERMGLVLEYFRRAGYVDLATESVRGWPRPADDPYAERLAQADPVYAVWGFRPR